jgi:hypothetical protein
MGKNGWVDTREHLVLHEDGISSTIPGCQADAMQRCFLMLSHRSDRLAAHPTTNHGNR